MYNKRGGYCAINSSDKSVNPFRIIKGKTNRSFKIRSDVFNKQRNKLLKNVLTSQIYLFFYCYRDAHINI